MTSWCSTWRSGSKFDLGCDRTVTVLVPGTVRIILMYDSCSRASVDDLQPPVLRSSALYVVPTPAISMLKYHPSDTRSSTEGYEGNLTLEEEVKAVSFMGSNLGGPQTR